MKNKTPRGCDRTTKANSCGVSPGWSLDILTLVTVSTPAPPSSSSHRSPADIIYFGSKPQNTRALAHSLQGQVNLTSGPVPRPPPPPTAAQKSADGLTLVKSHMHTRCGDFKRHCSEGSLRVSVCGCFIVRAPQCGCLCESPPVLRAIPESKQKTSSRPSSLCIDKRSAHPAFPLNMMAASSQLCQMEEQWLCRDSCVSVTTPYAADIWSLPKAQPANLEWRTRKIRYVQHCRVLRDNSRHCLLRRSSHSPSLHSYARSLFDLLKCKMNVESQF